MSLVKQNNCHKLHQGRFRLDIRKEILLRKNGNTLEQAAQGSGGLSVPGSVKEKGRCGTECHG